MTVAGVHGGDDLVADIAPDDGVALRRDLRRKRQPDLAQADDRDSIRAAQDWLLRPPSSWARSRTRPSLAERTRSSASDSAWSPSSLPTSAGVLVETDVRNDSSSSRNGSARSAAERARLPPG